MCDSGQVDTAHSIQLYGSCWDLCCCYWTSAHHPCYEAVSPHQTSCPDSAPVTYFSFCILPKSAIGSVASHKFLINVGKRNRSGPGKSASTGLQRHNDRACKAEAFRKALASGFKKKERVGSPLTRTELEVVIARLASQQAQPL